MPMLSGQHYGLSIDFCGKEGMTILDRFERFTNGIFKIFKIWHKIAVEEMSEFGLSASHVVYLIALYRNPDGLSSARLIELSEKDKSDVSRSLKVMMEQGLVEKQSAYQKGYAGTFYLTAKGMDIAHKISKKVSLAVEYANQDITDEKRAIFYEVLDKFSNNIAKIVEQGLSGIETVQSEREAK